MDVETSVRARENVTLDDKYALDHGRVLLTGTQALVRLLLEQRRSDAIAGFDTAGFVTGYRGSPLGGFDIQLARARRRLDAERIRFQPGVNEDLAATAVWGTQQVTLLPGARRAGVFALWYGKGPGVDRAGDAIKHGNRMGTTRQGGVLLAFGDDHPGKSSTIAHQSEPALAANGVPVLYPAHSQELIEFGLFGYALSRYSGLWVGLKCVNEVIEATRTVDLDAARPVVVQPVGSKLQPPEGHAHLRFEPQADEIRLVRIRLPLAQVFATINRIDRVTHDAERRGLGIVTAGKSWLDVSEALRLLQLDQRRCEQLGVRVYKPGLIWPIESTGLVRFAEYHRELLFVEDKAPFLESQAAASLYSLSPGVRPRLVGKSDEHGAPLLPRDVPLEPIDIALAIASRLITLELADATLVRQLPMLQGMREAMTRTSADLVSRTPYFCSGCPHNSSTRIPDGSLALAGIGCHGMALAMNRNTLPPTQMGGEGANWVGMAPFTEIPHVFQNLGDGTYFHSGLLAIRAAVTAGVNITYKLLYNDAVAMTGGQAVEGGLSVAQITHQLAAERIARIAVVADDVRKYGRRPGFAAGTTIHARESLDALQRELRATPGVSVLVYDQVCAAEKRRRRKRGTLARPNRRVFINSLVCEGCGDCSVQSNCVSIEPLETEFGRKRRIDQSSCNQDYSCELGFCPAFTTIVGGSRRAPNGEQAGELALIPLSEPDRAAIDGDYAILVAGVGGSGIVTVGAILAMAAHLDGLASTAYDMTGLAQKGGAVLSHLRIGARSESLTTACVGPAGAQLVLGCDLAVAASREVLGRVAVDRTRVVVNTRVVPTGAFQLNPDLDFKESEQVTRIRAAVGAASLHAFDASSAVNRVIGDAIGANLLLVGYALQRGWLPLSRSAIERAIELNGEAVEINHRALRLGRLAASNEAQFRTICSPGGEVPPETTEPRLERITGIRETFLKDYQDQAYAGRYRALVEAVRVAEERSVPGETRLTEVVARNYFKLLAYKDEYEVARLYRSNDFRQELESEFSGSYRIRIWLAPPLLARRDPVTGVPRKMSFGPWLLPVLGGLARLRRLRGTRFDPFGWTAERRQERALITSYEQLIGRLLSELSVERHALAVELAGLPEKIRGFGHVKSRAIRQAQERERQLLEQWDKRRGQHET